MAKIDFRGLIPGKRYKIVIHPETPYGKLRALPTIDFIVPEAPPRARNHRLEIKNRPKTVITGYKNRKFKIYKYKIEQNAAGKKVVVIITGNGTFKKNKIKGGDRIRVSAPAGIATTGYIVTPPGGTALPSGVVLAKNRNNTPKNRIKYLHPNQSVSTVGWTTHTTDDSATIANYPVTHVGGGAAITKKIPNLRIRIPKPIYQNLMWNDTVRDFVHIFYKTGSTKATVSGKRKYLITDTDLNRTSPIQDGVSGFSVLDTFPNGHPPVFSKQILDKKYYQFDFAIARYTRFKNADGTYTAWTGDWIEQNTPFDKKLSRPSGWKGQ